MTKENCEDIENICIPETEKNPKKKIKNSENKFFFISYGILLAIIFLLGIIATIITGTSPCLHTKCHELATCVNHPFVAECVCNYGYAGDGRDHCDECGRTFFKNNANEAGQTAVPYSWPATAVVEYVWTSLEKLETTKTFIYTQGMCGGVLINRQTILTTASCFNNSVNFYDWFTGRNYAATVKLNNFHPTLESIYNIYLGTHEYVNYYTDLPHVQVADFDEIIIHPEYNNQTLENNIAIVKLNKNVKLNRYIQIACLPNKTSTEIPDEDWGKLSLYIAGYSSAGSSFTTWVLQNLRFDMYNSSMCDIVRPNTTKNWDKQFCAGEYNDFGNATGTCHGDYGSASYAYMNVNGVMKYVAVGLLSHDVPCRTMHSPAIHTRLSYYLDWIKENSKYKDFN